MGYDYNFQGRTAALDDDLTSEREVEKVSVAQGSGGFYFSLFERVYNRLNFRGEPEETVTWDLEIESSVSGYRSRVRVPLMHDMPAALAEAFTRLAARCADVEKDRGSERVYVDGGERYSDVKTTSG